MSTLEQRKELARIAADQLDLGRKEQLRPRAFEDLARHDAAARLFFKGLELHYIECAASGRMDLWAKAAHNIVDLMAGDSIPFVRRRDLPPL